MINYIPRYAIGGIGAGRTAVSAVETFDPRLSSWMMGRPMNIDRAYFSAVVLDNVLFALGGLQGGTVLDSVCNQPQPFFVLFRE